MTKKASAFVTAASWMQLANITKWTSAFVVCPLYAEPKPGMTKESSRAIHGDVPRLIRCGASIIGTRACNISTPATMQSWQYGKPRMRWSHAAHNARAQRLHSTTAAFALW
jgi:hypothetical protein